jgi:hypothetical protein
VALLLFILFLGLLFFKYFVCVKVIYYPFYL